MYPQETLRAVRQFRDDERHSSSDSCVVVIMSHGKGDNQFYTHGGPSIHDEDLLDMFSNVGCPALEGKPKIFIFQFCRCARVCFTL